jgi:hypothetical protein
MTPQEYASKHKLKPTVVAYEHCISENGYRKQTLLSENKTNPSPMACRISQLLDYIRELGYEPPPPIFFD